MPTQKKTIEAQFDNLIDQYGNQKLKEMETTGFTNKGVHEYANIMQKTNSDKFTSMKKQGSGHSKVNKFSSSGVGNFQIVGSANAGLPPFSPTPMTVQKQIPGVKKESLPFSDRIDDTNEGNFVEFDLNLNNGDQEEDDAIEEDIDVVSENATKARNDLKENLRQKMQARKDSQSREQNSVLGTKPEFGTQIVNYQRNSYERGNSSSDDEFPHAKNRKGITS